MYRRLLILISTALSSASGHDYITTKITWSQEISRIFFKRCSGCHRQGRTAPALTTYDEVRPWAKAIRDEVLERRMPPWGAVKGFGEFRDDQSLSQPEMDLVVAWVEGGSPKGDEIYLPPLYTIESPPEVRKPSHRGLRVLESATLRSGMRIAALSPDGPTEAIAVRPDGTVHPLIRTLGTTRHIYWLREPLTLPARSRIIVTGAPLWLYR
jgi:hypothetical protein